MLRCSRLGFGLQTQNLAVESLLLIILENAYSVTEGVIKIVDAWLSNIIRFGHIRLNDLTKLQDDFEYAKGFIEDDTNSLGSCR